ncbi:MAG: nuclear transport factor 2 family protein [Pyrinomonadaceae bacterium]
MSEYENTNLVQQVYENFKSGDIKALLNLLSDDIEWQLPEIENVPFAGKRRGHHFHSYRSLVRAERLIGAGKHLEINSRPLPFFNHP